MWLTFIALVLVIAAIVASAFAGGIFTIVLIPLAFVAVVGAIGAGMYARAQDVGAGQTESTTSDSTPQTPANALPRQRGARAHAGASPGQLADARRERQ
jgi:hypothetical protein